MTSPLLSIVVIGRNEGARLGRCLESIQEMEGLGERCELIYVDSASSDGSAQLAQSFGADTVVLCPLRPTAALGRNTGWRKASGELILFLDGDTTLHPSFVASALPSFQDGRIAVVWGHRRELYPRASVFNRVLDLDWIYPAGLSDFCGGDAIMRRSALEQAGGFDDALIAGEEPELCARLRSQGWQIVHIDRPMTGHDLAIHSLREYWRRATRAGYAYAEVSERFKDTPTALWAEDARRNRQRAWLMSSGVLVAIAACWLLRSAVPALAAVSLFLLLSGRTAWRVRAKSDDALTLVLYGMHSHLQQIPIYVGQLRQKADRHSAHKRGLIEYKAAS